MVYKISRESLPVELQSAYDKAAKTENDPIRIDSTKEFLIFSKAFEEIKGELKVKEMDKYASIEENINKIKCMIEENEKIEQRRAELDAKINRLRECETKLSAYREKYKKENPYKNAMQEAVKFITFDLLDLNDDPVYIELKNECEKLRNEVPGPNKMMCFTYHEINW
ncbi:hypothetical protein IKQ21_07200 [bacterium]|nr:hypothetical protein [bacterium]